MKNCHVCHQDWPEDRFNPQCSAPDTCFRCRSKGVSVALQGGRDYWHNGTEKARARKAIAEAKAGGFDPVPAETGKAWNSAAPSTFSKIGDISRTHGAFGFKPVTDTPRSVA